MNNLKHTHKNTHTLSHTKLLEDQKSVTISKKKRNTDLYVLNEKSSFNSLVIVIEKEQV